MDPREVMKSAVRLDTKVMESRHYIGQGQYAKKKTVVVVKKSRAAKPGAKKWD